tara:strand:+ start:4378 stop:5814 length:1437 start_codon:yes stop_codon:yes gene_type:complete
MTSILHIIGDCLQDVVLRGLPSVALVYLSEKRLPKEYRENSLKTLIPVLIPFIGLVWFVYVAWLWHSSYRNALWVAKKHKLLRIWSKSLKWGVKTLLSVSLIVVIGLQLEWTLVVVVVTLAIVLGSALMIWNAALWIYVVGELEEIREEIKPEEDKEALVRVEGMKMYFPVKGGIFQRAVSSCKAVDNVDLEIKEGETLGLVGESGCGKTTLGKTIVRLHEPTAGSIRFKGVEITSLRQAMKPFRRDIQMVFQDPAESLDARMSVGAIISEPLVIQRIGTRQERQKRVEDLLNRVGMPKSAVRKFPFEFSGGQRQRIGIARALAVNPDLLILDEPVSALDVSVQSQVLNLLMDLQRDFGLSYLFISHDLAVVKHVSDRIAVMYLGKIVELAQADELYANPRHAYTKALIAAIPVPDPSVEREHKPIEGDVPSPIDPPPGCAFGHRVSAPEYEKSIDKEIGLKEIAPGHWVSDCPCCVE